VARPVLQTGVDLRMKRLAITFFAVGTLCCLCAREAAAQDAHEIVKRADQKMRGGSQYAEITMTIVKPDWSREMSMKSWMLASEYALVLITAPAREQGQVTLKRGNEIWNWIPSIGRQIKIPPSMMMQSWMGSDFTNDDLVKESSIVTDYTQTLAGDSTVGSYDCYRIRLVPKPDAAVVWGKILIFISKDGDLELQADYYDEEGNLVRRMVGSKVQEMGGRTIPVYWEILPMDKVGEKTVLEYTRLDFGIDVKESFFSIQNMKRIR
jgi:outer membrane lipoprotein-sorting protein